MRLDALPFPRSSVSDVEGDPASARAYHGRRSSGQAEQRVGQVRGAEDGELHVRLQAPTHRERPRRGRREANKPSRRWSAINGRAADAERARLDSQNVVRWNWPAAMGLCAGSLLLLLAGSSKLAANEEDDRDPGEQTQTSHDRVTVQAGRQVRMTVLSRNGPAQRRVPPMATREVEEPQVDTVVGRVQRWSN